MNFYRKGEVIISSVGQYKKMKELRKKKENMGITNYRNCKKRHQLMSFFNNLKNVPLDTPNISAAI